MYFYRIMKKDELKSKKIHNMNSFYYYINTHKYKRFKKYVHLFLNAESCFEYFDKSLYEDSIIGQFDIPDEIVFKYGIGLGCYNLARNDYNKKYRNLNNRNAQGQVGFWLPEISIESKDFDYNWLTDMCIPKDNNGNYYLKDTFITDDLHYQNIVYNGYLIGYNSYKELEKKYNDELKLKQKILEILKNNKKININPKDFNNDSLYTCEILINYALKHNFINFESEIKITLNKDLQIDSINLTNEFDEQVKEKVIIINKSINYSNQTFTSRLAELGFIIDKNILHSITNEEDVIIEHKLIKK